MTCTRKKALEYVNRTLQRMKLKSFDQTSKKNFNVLREHVIGYLNKIRTFKNAPDIRDEIINFLWDCTSYLDLISKVPDKKRITQLIEVMSVQLEYDVDYKPQNLMNVHRSICMHHKKYLNILYILICEIKLNVFSNKIEEAFHIIESHTLLSYCYEIICKTQYTSILNLNHKYDDDNEEKKDDNDLGRTPSDMILERLKEEMVQSFITLSEPLKAIVYLYDYLYKNLSTYSELQIPFNQGSTKLLRAIDEHHAIHPDELYADVDRLLGVVYAVVNLDESSKISWNNEFIRHIDEYRVAYNL